MWTILELKSLEGPNRMGTPTNCEIYFQEFDQVSTVNIREESFHVSYEEMEKGSFKKYTRSLCSS